MQGEIFCYRYSKKWPLEIGVSNGLNGVYPHPDFQFLSMAPHWAPPFLASRG